MATPIGVRIKMVVFPEEREGHWAALMGKFRITVYGDSEEAVYKRAQDMLDFIVSRFLTAYGPADLCAYLDKRGVEYDLIHEAPALSLEVEREYSLA